METMELAEIEVKVNELAVKINAPSNVLPTFGHSQHTGRPHVEVDARGYHYIIAERGQEFDRHTTSDLDELLYRIFANLTFELSTRFELAHRVENQDHRRIMFQHQIELLSSLSPQWGEREAKEHERILKEHPFDDHASPRAIYFKSLTDKGYSSKQAEKMALDKYPLPKRT